MLKRLNVNFTYKADGDLEALNDTEYERIMKGCLRLESNPAPDGKHIKKLRGYKDLYRLRIGDYRIVFQWKNDAVDIIRIITRQDFGKLY